MRTPTAIELVGRRITRSQSRARDAGSGTGAATHGLRVGASLHRTMVEFRVFIAEKAYALLHIQHQAMLIEQAMKTGLPVEMDGEVRKTKLLSDVTIDEHKRRTEIDLNNKLREAQESVRLMIIAKHLSEHQKISISQDLIDSVVKQIDAIENDQTLSLKAKQRMIAAREEVIITFEEERRGREKRLLEAHIIGRLPEATDAGVGSEPSVEPEPVGVPPKRGRGRPRKSDAE